MSYFDVGDFHEKFKLPHLWDDDYVAGPHTLDDNTFLFRFGFLLEELAELQQAHQRGDLAGIADALIDLVYVAYGTAHLMHLPWSDLWSEVHKANLAKERGETDKRGHTLDVRKPFGWEPPDIEGVLRRFGWTPEDEAAS